MKQPVGKQPARKPSARKPSVGKPPIGKPSAGKPPVGKPSAGKQPGSPHRAARVRQAWLKAFIWIFIAIFLLGSVGAVALIAFH
jgi:hypothetical protein